MDSNDVRQQWADRSGAYSPEYYAYYGPNETSEAIRQRLEGQLEPSASVLELGCSCGRHLSHLYEHGFENVAGIELNADAFDVMGETYPELAAEGEFYCEAIEDIVGEFDDDQFDAVYSVETLQHIHPDASWVFEELARITDEVLVTAENEGEGAADNEGEGAADNEGEKSAESRTDKGVDLRDDTDTDDADADHPSSAPDVNYVDDDFPLYYRDWNAIFTDLGFIEVDTEYGKRDTIRTFCSSTDRTNR